MSRSRDHRREERQYKHPNFRAAGQLFLVRCFACSERGTENHAGVMAAGYCAWCGWSDGDPIYSCDSGSEGSEAQDD